MAFVSVVTTFQKTIDDGTIFPLVLVPKKDGKKDATALADEVAQRHEWLDSQLANSGAILFRGFDISTPQEFNSFVEALGWEEFPYTEAGGAATRTRVFGKVLTINEGLPVSEPLGFHNEACYLDQSPTRVMFFCEVPPGPGCGGETSILHGSTMCRRALEVCNDFVENSKAGISFIRKGATEDESPLRTYGASVKKDRAGRLSWFNSIGFFIVSLQKDFDMVLGGERHEPKREELDALMKVMEEEKVVFQWEKGDILLLDNTAVQHARESSKTPDRKILISLTK